MDHRSAYSNVGEMLWSDEVRGVLRLCGANERMIGEDSSDYERFLALAEAMPMLDGHPLKGYVASLLKDCFEIETSLDKSTCEEIWRKAAQRLLSEPIFEVGAASDMEQGKAVTVAHPSHHLSLTSAFSGLLFARTRAKSFDVWMREIESVVYDAVRSGCRYLFFGLPDAFCDVKPSLYHVNMTLHRGAREKGDLDLLYAQLVRCLSQVCQTHGLTLILQIETASEHIRSLMDRVEREVGLPTLIWSTPREDVRAEMLDFSAKAHKNPIFAAIRRTDYGSDDAFSQALVAWAKCYPIGRLIELRE